MGFSFFRRTPGPSDSKLTALHIDDSRWVRIPVSVILRRHFGMRVLEASNGPDGLELALHERPDLIILDVMMPRMDGFDVLVKLKEHPSTRSIPVLMCTARDVTREVNMAVKLGVSGYLTKPIDEDQLIAKVEEILRDEGKWGHTGATQVVVPPPPPDHQTDLVIPSPQKPTCPQCQQTLQRIEQYNAWYCYACRQYPEIKTK